MDVIDQTGVPSDVAFSAIALGEGFVVSGELYIKQNTTDGIRVSDLAVIPNIVAPSAMVSPRDLAITVKFPIV